MISAFSFRMPLQQVRGLFPTVRDGLGVLARLNLNALRTTRTPTNPGFYLAVRSEPSTRTRAQIKLGGTLGI